MLKFRFFCAGAFWRDDVIGAVQQEFVGLIVEI